MQICSAVASRKIIKPPAYGFININISNCSALRRIGPIGHIEALPVDTALHKYTLYLLIKYKRSRRQGNA